MCPRWRRPWREFKRHYENFRAEGNAGGLLALPLQVSRGGVEVIDTMFEGVVHHLVYGLLVNDILSIGILDHGPAHTAKAQGRYPVSVLGILIDDNLETDYNYGSAVHGEDQIAPYGITVKTTGGWADRTNTHVKSSTWNNLLTWDKNFGDHNVNLMAGQEFYSYDEEYNYGYGEGIMNLGQFELASRNCSSSTASWWRTAR